ncbi:hypothetical protein ACP26L_26755 [Paenibacillus sp. S-38]|uniref:hypothetical protein n=1 Tax=Paenibacillus sp. S-38 TaxID=3416710 RepID=UPI003CEC9386
MLPFLVILVPLLLFAFFVMAAAKSNARRPARPPQRPGYRPLRSGTGAPRPQRRPSRLSYEDAALPAGLGLQPDIPLAPAAARLEQALGSSYTEQLRHRVMARQPGMTRAEFDWTFLELKRYFLMAAVLRDVPMFSGKVDALWHEMLMFTREYNAFGEGFIGSVIHHAPHTGGGPDPGGRAWFDWVYANLFVHTPYSDRLWGPFFRHPLTPALLTELKASGEGTLSERLFNPVTASRYPEIREAAALLAARAREQASRPADTEEYPGGRPAYHSSDYMPFLAGALMFYSAGELSSFDERMEEQIAEEEAQRRQQDAANSGGTDGGGAWDDSGGDGYDDGGGNDGGDQNSGGDGGGTDGSGGGSSCSSSGCSSGSGSSCSSSSCSSGGGSSSSCSSSSCSSGCGGGT